MSMSADAGKTLSNECINSLHILKKMNDKIINSLAFTLLFMKLMRKAFNLMQKNPLRMIPRFKWFKGHILCKIHIANVFLL